MTRSHMYKTSIKISLGLLCLLAVPATVHAATTDTTISSEIGSVISLLSSSGTVNIDATPTASGVQTIAADTVTVSTNNVGGYTLKLGEKTASTDLKTTGGDTIPAIGGTASAPIAETANTWGYRIDGGNFGAGPTTGVSNQPIGTAKFAAVPATASPDTIKTTSDTASSDTTSVWYGVAVDTSTPSGTYTNDVTYTATAN